MELDQLRQERELLREEIAQVSARLKASRDELQETERRLESGREQAGQSLQLLQDSLQEERRKRQTAEEDCRAHAEVCPKSFSCQFGITELRAKSRRHSVACVCKLQEGNSCELDRRKPAECGNVLSSLLNFLGSSDSVCNFVLGFFPFSQILLST